jgi:DNA-binding NarL/FixJ family response regulator
MTSKRTRIVLIDDHPVVRRGMNDLLSHEPDLLVCGEAEGETDALVTLEEQKPDVVVLDLTLKDGNGVDLIKQIRGRFHDTRIVVLTMHDESLFGARCFRAGAAGFVNKEEASEKVIEAIRTVCTGRLYLSDRLAERVLRRAFGNAEDPSGSELDNLTDRELEVFGMIGRGMTTRQIADRLHLSHKTIESYRENIKAKLNLQNAVELTQRAVRWTMELE